MRSSKKPSSKKSTPNKLQQSKQPNGDLGETDASSSEDQGKLDASSSEDQEKLDASSSEDQAESGSSSSTDQELAADDRGFHSPPPDTDGTDYGLDFTDTGTRYLANTSKDQSPVPANTSVEKPRENPKEISKLKQATNDKTPVPSKTASIPMAEKNKDAKTTISTTAGVSKRVAQKRQAQRDLNYLRTYKKLAARVDYMIPRAAFARIVREIMQDLGTDITFITVSALEALQTATEAYVQGRLEDANLLALHARRITLMAKDMELISYLRGKER